ncbi:MAG: GGDEF domain-containing protein [Cohaesibacter sp.]|jgi:diguanylate cyclase (GGDEF)-like protein|nr:GGDEF domain-containing protein [Cohaesibacter sp.]
MAVQTDNIEGGLYAIFDQVSDAVFVIDAAGNSAYQNHQAHTFPQKYLNRLIKLFTPANSREKSHKIEMGNWEISISNLGDHLAFICKYNSAQQDKIRALRKTFMEGLAKGGSPKQAAIDALRTQTNWRWISIGTLDHKKKQILFEAGYDGPDFCNALMAPASPNANFCPCSGLEYVCDLSTMFADLAPFEAVGLTHFMGMSLKNHVGDCVGYAMLGHDEEPQDIREVGILMEALSDLYGPYFEADTAREAAEKAQKESLTDSATGLGNRRACEAFIEECLQEDKREQSEDEVHAMFNPHAMRNSVLMLADYDGFKRINDTMGHEEGDRALTLLGHYLRQHQSPGNQIFRLGGDEFVQIFPRAGNLEAMELRDWVTTIERHLNKAGFDGLGISIGVVNFFEGDGSYSSLMTLADARMYQDKKMRSVHFAC